MQDPKPENIAGSKQVVHKVEHRIDWGYVALGVGGLAVAYVLYRLMSAGSESEEVDLSDSELFEE